MLQLQPYPFYFKYLASGYITLGHTYMKQWPYSQCFCD
jgi:hypothetical protein